MPKLKDFYAKLKEQGKIENEEYNKFLETVPDAEIPDAVVAAIEDKFYTFERAAAHKDIHGKIKREVLNPVDNEIAELFSGPLKEYIDPMLEAEFKQDGSSYRKLKAMKKLIPEVIEKVKAKPVLDEDSKKKLAEYERNIQEMTQKFKDAEKDYGAKLTAQKEESEKHLHDYKLDIELQNRGNKFTLAEAYEQNRKDLSNMLLNGIKQSNALKLVDINGQTEIQVLDEHGKTKFNGNSPVTIDSLLEEKYKPFLKQSGGGTGNQNRQQEPPRQGQQQQNQTTVRRGARTTVE